MTSKIITWGEDRPITIQLPDRYWDVLFAMAQMEGRKVEDLATERLQQIISEDVIHAEEGHFGALLVKGWAETLEDDPYFKIIGGGG